MSKMFEALQYAYTELELENTKKMSPPTFIKQELPQTKKIPSTSQQERTALPTREILPILRTIPPSSPHLKIPISNLRMESEMIQLNQALSTLLPDRQKNIVQFIGSHHGVGTSTILREFGTLLASHYGKSVLLVDVGPQVSTSQHQAFGIVPKEPLEYAMRHRIALHAAISQIHETGIYLAHLLEDKAQDRTDFNKHGGAVTWDSIRTQFDIILLDCPPLHASNKSFALTGSSDGVIMIVEAEKTRSPVILTLKNRIIDNGGNLLGIVFNKQQHYIPQWAYKFV